MIGEYTHKGKPESSDLSGWIEWAESIDGCPCGENMADYQNQGGQYDFQLVSIGYVLELLQQIREMNIDIGGFIDLLNNPIKDKQRPPESKRG